MPPRKLAPPSVFKGEVRRKGSPIDAVVKKDSLVPVKSDTLPNLSKRPPSSPVAAANIKLPVRPPTKRPLPVSPAVPLSSATPPATGGTATGSTEQASRRGSSPTPPLPAAAAHATGHKSVEERAGKVSLLSREASSSTSAVKSPWSSQLLTSPPPSSLPLPLEKPLPPAQSAVPPSKSAGAPASPSLGSGATPDNSQVKMPPPTATKKGPPIPLGKPGALSSPDALASKEKAAPAPPAKKGPPLPSGKTLTMPSPKAEAPVITDKSPPSPPAKKGPPVPSAKSVTPPSPGAGGLLMKEMPPPPLAAKKGPPLSSGDLGGKPTPDAGASVLKGLPVPTPLANKKLPTLEGKPGASPSSAAVVPTIKEKSAAAPPAKKGPPISTGEPGALTSPDAGAPAVKEKLGPAIPGKKGPPVAPGKAPPKAVAPDVMSPTNAPAAGARGAAGGTAAAGPSDGTPVVRMKTGIVGVGPPPGVHPKLARTEKAEDGTPGATPATFPQKKAGPPLGAVGKVPVLQKATPSSVPAVAAGVEKREADKSLGVAGTFGAAVKTPASAGGASAAPSTGAQPGSSPPETPLCKIVDLSGKPVGYAHGPPSPLKLQDPSSRRAGSEGRRVSGSLWLADRSPLLEPLPYSSRSTYQAHRAAATAGGGRTGGVQYLAPFGVPPGWDSLPGFFFPVPAWPPYLPAGASAGYPEKPMGQPSDRGTSDTRGGDKRRRQKSRCRLQQQQQIGPHAAAQSLYPPTSCYYPTPSHPFFAYPYYTAAFDTGPYSSAFHNQQQMHQPQGLLPYNFYPSTGYSGSPSLSRAKKESRRRRLSGSSGGEALANTDEGPSYPCSDKDEDPLQMAGEYSGRRPKFGAYDYQRTAVEPPGRSRPPAEKIRGAAAGYYSLAPRGQGGPSGENYEELEQVMYQTDWSPNVATRTFQKHAADSGICGQAPWMRLERKLNQIRGGYGLNRDMNSEALRSHVERSLQREKGEKDGRQLQNGLASARQERSAFAASRRRSSTGPFWQGDYSGGYAEDQQDEEDLLSGDQYYKCFNARYQREKKPWVDEVVPRRTYQSLNELAAHFSHIDGEDQDELISLLLLCRRLERQIEEQHLVVDMLEHELATASATLKFPPEWRALEGIDLVSLVPADSAFQPSAAAPLFLKSTVLLPKQLADGSSALCDARAIPGGETAPTAATVAAHSAKGGAGVVPPSSAPAGTPTVTVKPEPSLAVGPAKTPVGAAPGIPGGPKPPPPSASIKKATKGPGIVKTPAFKTSIKAK